MEESHHILPSFFLVYLVVPMEHIPPPPPHAGGSGAASRTSPRATSSSPPLSSLISVGMTQFPLRQHREYIMTNPPSYPPTLIHTHQLLHQSYFPPSSDPLKHRCAHIQECPLTHSFCHAFIPTHTHSHITHHITLLNHSLSHSLICSIPHSLDARACVKISRSSVSHFF